MFYQDLVGAVFAVNGIILLICKTYSVPER